MKSPTRFTATTMALVITGITGITPAFGEVTTPPATTQTSTTTAASTTPTATTSNNVATGTGATTTPSPTAGMNKGQTDIATSLAKAQLAQYGITDPTPQQLNSALNGGTLIVGTGTGAKTVQLEGVLTQRAAGQGWGQIANGMGIKLGTAVSATKSQHHALQETERGEHSKHITTAAGGEYQAHTEKKHIKHGGGDAKHTARDSHKHITTAAGASGGVYSREQGKHHSTTVSTAGGKAEVGRHEQGKRYGAGIVTAAGGSYMATNHSRSHSSGQGAGIVTASASSSGAGQGHADSGKSGKSGK